MGKISKKLGGRGGGESICTLCTPLSSVSANFLAHFLQQHSLQQQQQTSSINTTKIETPIIHGLILQMQTEKET